MVGRYPAIQLMSREPIRNQLSPLNGRRCRHPLLRSISRSFLRLSSCCGQVAHALRTLAPVAAIVLLQRAAPRLACVKPAASVHPEPGSNSPLYNLYKFQSNPALLFSKEIHACSFQLLCYNCLVLFKVLSLPSFQSTFPTLLPKRAANIAQ